jgi:hypothetical protein
MIQKIKNLFLVGVASFAMVAPGLLMPVATHAATISQNICKGSTAASGDDDCGNDATIDDGLTKLATTVTTWFTIVVGAISVIMIIYGGFRYITSGGDSGKVGSAKNTIIYAIIGLIVVVLAQVIVNVVIKQSETSSGNF